MAEKFVIVVTPPDKDRSSLSVEDAMQQVLDAFHLLISSSESDESITWELVNASTNSPLRVEAEARSKKIGVEVDLVAKQQKESFLRNYNQLINGEVPESWQKGGLRQSAESFIRRNHNGIANTRIELDEDNIIELTRENAGVAFNVFELPLEREVKPYTLMGSVEGVIIEVGTHYKVPAIKIRERITGNEIWCVVDRDHIDQISKEAGFDDVWLEHRVIVRGKLEYNNIGNLNKVYAVDVSPIISRDVSIEEIKDKDFTQGLSPAEYIDKLREGDFD